MSHMQHVHTIWSWDIYTLGGDIELSASKGFLLLISFKLTKYICNNITWLGDLSSLHLSSQHTIFDVSLWPKKKDICHVPNSLLRIYFNDLFDDLYHLYFFMLKNCGAVVFEVSISSLLQDISFSCLLHSTQAEDLSAAKWLKLEQQLTKLK